MKLSKSSLLICFIVIVTQISSCSKDKQKAEPPYTIRTVSYIVTGTRFKLNFIDSNSVFQENLIYTTGFRYEFQAGSGSEIGISIFKSAPDDLIYSWEIYIDDKLYANAFSEGGAYFTVPKF
jgi:hypothetical protein